MDIAGIKPKSPGKYDAHIRETVESLKGNKNIQALLSQEAVRRRPWGIRSTRSYRGVVLTVDGPYRASAIGQRLVRRSSSGAGTRSGSRASTRRRP